MKPHIEEAWRSLRMADRDIMAFNILAGESAMHVSIVYFHAQQSVEKALKAVCLKHAISFPYVHDLARLLTVRQQGGVRVPKYVLRAAGLTRFAVETRYPGLSGPVTKREHRKIVRIAAEAVRCAERQVK